MPPWVKRRRRHKMNSAWWSGRNLLSFIFLLSSLWQPPPWHLRWNTKSLNIFHSCKLAFTDSPRGQRAALLGGGEDSCPGRYALGPGLFRSSYQFPLGRISDTEPSGFSEPEWLWGRRGPLCLLALMCAEARIQTGTHDPSILFSEKHRFWTTVKALWFRFYIVIRQVTLKQ